MDCFLFACKILSFLFADHLMMSGNPLYIGMGLCKVVVTFPGLLMEPFVPTNFTLVRIRSSSETGQQACIQ